MGRIGKIPSGRKKRLTGFYSHKDTKTQRRQSAIQIKGANDEVYSASIQRKARQMPSAPPIGK